MPPVEGEDATDQPISHVNDGESAVQDAVVESGANSSEPSQSDAVTPAVDGEDYPHSGDASGGNETAHDVNKFVVARGRAHRRYMALKTARERFPLHGAAMQGDAEAVSKLVQSKVNVDSVDDAGRTPLRYACNEGQLACARVLLSNKASVDLPDRTTLTTPLMVAAGRGNGPLVKELLAKHADISIKDRMSETALTKVMMFAEGDVEQVTRLLEEAQSLWPLPWVETSRNNTSPEENN